MAVPWKSPGNIPSAKLNGSTSHLYNSGIASVPGTGFWYDHLHIMYKYMTQNRRGGKGEGYNLEASCNPSFPPLLNQQPVNPGTCIPFWKNHMWFNSWTPPLCLLKKNLKQTKNKPKNPQTTNKKIPTTPTKTTKKKKLPQNNTPLNNLVTKISSTITERLNWPWKK